jgi:4-diphosphocytidyl-2-C-methyl-D-erythritol kinase
VTAVTAVTARVPAKVNLQLAVGPVRADGYHDLVTVFHAVSLFDEVTVTPAEHDSVTVTGEGAAQVPTGPANLAARAAAALLAAAGPGVRDSPGLAIRIRKRIPVAAGLAGGSADAAAALVACNELWRAGLSQHDLCEIAATLGSDVTFALIGGTAVGLGRGERVTPALTSGTFHWVLAFADGGLPTAEVYAASDRLRARHAHGRVPGAPPPAAAGAGRQGAGRQGAGGQGAGRQGAGRQGAAGRHPAAGGAGGVPGHAGGEPPPGGSGGQRVAALPPLAAGAHPPGSGPPALDTALMAALRSGDPVALGRRLANDLQPAALSLRPGLRRALRAGEELGALGAIVSGSGPTCVFLARDTRHAKSLAVGLTSAGVCRSVVTAVGPVPGATVVPVEAQPG